MHKQPAPHYKFKMNLEKRLAPCVPIYPNAHANLVVLWHVPYTFIRFPYAYVCWTIYE